MTLDRPGWACPGHPRLSAAVGLKDVDARDERAHDGAGGVVAAMKEIAR
jgi:hypothetical protein